MRILILGGTVFLGRHLTAAALARGHEVSLFTRGQHNPDIFPEARKVRGDRKKGEDVAALAESGDWDAVVDTCGYLPGDVRRSAGALAGRAPLYCFISTVSVYADRQGQDAPMDEASPLAPPPDDPETDQVTGETYGPLKVLCEQAAEEAFPGRTLVIRPGLIVGPHDPSDRFTYWPRRVARGGDILAPDGPAMPTQFIDVRDLAEWNLRLLEQGVAGVYNADGPLIPLNDVLDSCQRAVGAPATITYVSESFLQEQEVQPWMELPLWIPAEHRGPGFDSGKAVRDGLTYRDLDTTVRDTLAWDASRPQENAWRHALKPEKEAAVLAAWRAR